MRTLSVLSAIAMLGCASDPVGLAPAPPAATTVKMDFFHRPLPEIALPNDIATRYDDSSATLRRINASMVAPTGFEARTRELIDQLDGWGVFQPITIPFTGPLDVQSILDGHSDVDYEPSNDVIYLIDISPESPEYGKTYPLDLGNGNYPVVLEERDNYWKNDPRVDTMSILFEEVDEDVNGNGLLDPGEDTDADGVLDRPNYLPGQSPAPDDLAARADALMTFYERETNTVIARPMEPLRERTTYAVVVTRRILDESGQPVGSPFEYINHTAQTRQLRPLVDVLPAGLSVDDIAFAFPFTTQSIQSHWIAVRDGLYGHGVQAHLGEDYPARLASVEKLRDDGAHPNMTNPHLMYAENFLEATQLIEEALGGGFDESRMETRRLFDSIRYIDYYVIGSFDSPQLFAREDADGNPLGLNDQSWPPDLDRVPAPARPETVYFTLTMPRDVTETPPLVILGHGYTSQRYASIMLAGFLAKYGVAVLAIDGPSHGISINENQTLLVENVFGSVGLRGAAEAILASRATDQNGDGRLDSGADFWTSYLFHTRDMVRQFALDYSQLVRVLRSFDGERRWDFDLDGDGQPELAGDFNADGIVDVGGNATMVMTGGSLGGIMSMLMGSLEPELEAIAPMAGGGGYSDMGIRSGQGGVLEAFILRGMGPLYTGVTDPDTGLMTLETIVPDLNDTAEREIASANGVEPGDLMIVRNLINEQVGCGYVDDSGSVRASVESDAGDATAIEFYRGVYVGPECELEADDPYLVIDTLEVDVDFQGRTLAAGSPLESLADGLGLRRGNPDLRRFQGFGQLVLDPSDPASYARNLLREPMEFSAGGGTPGAHALVLTTAGDMNVPASSGATYGRAAGIIDYQNPDPRFGVPANQVLIDTYMSEAVHNLNRFTDSTGAGVHIDVENFSGGDDIWGTEVPRLETPLRIGFDQIDALGGISAALFPLTNPEGDHGMDRPGRMIDRFRDRCAANCGMQGDDPCGCADAMTYDIGNYLLSMVARYLASGGTFLSDDLCQSRDDCPDLPPVPEPRDVNELR